jgi:hypothetical protein
MPEINEQPNNESELIEELIGEPVTRPDGRVVTLHKIRSGVRVHNGSIGCDIPDALVEEIGFGNWGVGAARLAQFAYHESDPFLGVGQVHQLVKELKLD